MKVVLIDEVPSLGIAGDVRDVKAGYARNYLIPKRLAVLATAQELARAESRRKAEVTRRTRLNTEMSSVAEQLEGAPLLLPVRVGPGGRLYGSVTAAEIAQAVSERVGAEVDRRAVELGQPIREQGHHQVRLRLAPDVYSTVTVTVYPEGGTPPPLEEEAAAAESGETGAAEAEAEEAASTALEEAMAAADALEAAEAEADETVGQPEEERAALTAPAEEEEEGEDAAGEATGDDARNEA